MPELPEIETVKRTLTPLLPGSRIEEVCLLQPTVIAYPHPSDFVDLLRGATIKELGRRGKYLLISLGNGGTLIAHLRMTGRFMHVPTEAEVKPHTHVIFNLNHEFDLRFSDVRRFGRLWLLGPGEEDNVSGIHKLGLEPLDPACNSDYYQERLHKRRVTIKQGLLDQTVVAGLGNIYVDEALFVAAIDPRRLCCQLEQGEWQALAECIPQILLGAIANNGTTFRDYLDGEGNKGRNLPHLKAYGRAGQPCSRCGTILEKLVVSGRGTTYCPRCQK